MLAPFSPSLMAHLPVSGSLTTAVGLASWTASVGDQMGASQATWQRFNAMIKSSDENRAAGGYVGWLSRVANGEICRRGSHQSLMGLLMFFDCGGSVSDYEQYVGAIVGPKADVAKTVVELRNRRLELILKEGGPLLEWKVAELSDTAARILPAGEMFPRSRWFQQSSGTQMDAYVADESLCRLLREIDQKSALLRRRQERNHRSEVRSRLLKEFLSWVPNSALLTNREIVHALRTLGDSFSLRIARSIERGDLELRLRPLMEFNQEVGDISRRLFKNHPADSSTLNAYYVRGERLEKWGVLFARTRPLGMGLRVNREDVLFEVLALIVHEYQHHLDMRPGESQPLSDQFPLELKAHAREFLWRAHYGDVEYLEEYARESAVGFALRFRDRFERFAG